MDSIDPAIDSTVTLLRGVVESLAALEQRASGRKRQQVRNALCHLQLGLDILDPPAAPPVAGQGAAGGACGGG